MFWTFVIWWFLSGIVAYIFATYLEYREDGKVTISNRDVVIALILALFTGPIIAICGILVVNLSGFWDRSYTFKKKD